MCTRVWGIILCVIRARRDGTPSRGWRNACRITLRAEARNNPTLSKHQWKLCFENETHEHFFCRSKKDGRNTTVYRSRTPLSFRRCGSRSY